MKHWINIFRVPVICAALTLGTTLWAAKSDESGDSDATPSPSPSHGHRARVHHSASGSPTQSPSHHAHKNDDEGSDASPTPSPTHRKHASADEDADVTPTPSPGRHKHETDENDASVTPTPVHHPRKGSDDEDATEESPTPRPAAKKHRIPAAEDTDEQTPSSTPTAKHSQENDQQDNGDMFASPTPKPRPSIAADATIDPAELTEYSRQPAKVQALINAALALTSQNLTYTYGSDDPANGGMDCSGFIYYVLTQAGLKDVPRDASEQYSWVRKAENFRAVISRKLDGFEMDELKPGDLLFWTGTYQVDRDPPVTHTMIYLGREKATGKRVMVGSSDGRSYHGAQRWGVSVFDFKESPPPGTGRGNSLFIGYGSIPGLTTGGDEGASRP